MPFIDKLRFRKAEKKVKTESEEKGKEEELHLTKEGKVKKKNEKREKEEELHLTKEGKVKKKVKKNKKKEKEENSNLMEEGKVKKKKHKKGGSQDEVDLTEEGKVKKKKKKKKEKEEESNLTEEEKEKAKQQEKEEKKKKKKDKKEQEELNLTEEEKEDKKHQEKEEKKKKKKDKKEQEEEPNLTKVEKEKEKQEKKKQEKEEKRKKKNKELEKEEEPNVTKEEKGKQKQEDKKKQKEKEKKKKKNESDEKQEEPNLTKEEKVKKKTEKKGKEEESNLTKEKKVKKKNEKSEKEDEPNLTKEKKAKEKQEDKKKQEKEEKRKKKTEKKDKEEESDITKEEKEKEKQKKKQEKEEKVKKKTENREKEEELKLTKEEKGKDKQEEKKKKQKELEDEEEVDGITRFGEAITETEWEGVTRFGETGPIERITTFTSEGSYMVAEKTEDGMQYTEIEAGRMAEYETVRIMRTRNMSVIEEEEEEEYEVGEDIDDEGEVVGMNVGVFAEVLAAWVLQEAFQEVGRAWDKVTTAWEEMTYGELVQLRETTHRRELYKTLSMPPENELMKGSERQLSEAELRVRRSLQRLDVPEWMKNAPPQQQGFLLRRRDYGSSSAPAGGWSAYSSKTASMTSLGSSRAVTPNTPTKVVIPTRVATRGVGGIGGITSPASNCSISPSPSDRSGSLFQYPISRWSTSRLNSGTTTPTGSVTSARTTATYTRQPYLGWRSQTSLASLAGSQSSLTSTGSYLTAADRLALGITSYSQRFVKTTPSTQDKENSSSEANAAAPKSENADQNDTGSTNGSVKLQVPPDVADVHSSIKEVTSAIVHYCNESTPSPRASPRGSPRPDGRAPSPRRLVWVESSFVGSRPITSPETPTSSTHAITPTSQLNGHDLPESGEVTSRPPQPPGEYLLAW